MSDKPYHLMDDGELMAEKGVWAEHVETAGGWASAHFAARQLAAICEQLARRGLDASNPYPISYGSSPPQR